MLNTYTSNNRASKNRNQKLSELKEEIGKSTIIAVDFNPVLSVIDNRSRQKYIRI